MTVYQKLVLFQFAIVIPFVAGCAARPRIAVPEALSRRLLQVNIMGLEPLIVLWCTWGLALTAGLAVLPLFGFGLVVAGVLAGSLAATGLGLSGRRRKAFLVSCSLANHGFTMGGALCYFFFGEKGLGYSVILVLYFIPYVYCLVFPYARAGAGSRLFSRGELKSIVCTARNLPLAAMGAGLLLSLAGIAKPVIDFPVDVLLVLSIGLYYFTLGITFTGIDLAGSWRELAVLCGIKFIAIPGAAYLVLLCLPLEPTIRGVVQLQAFMPAAIYSVVTAVLFDQDAGLASSLFVSSTAVFLLVVLPLMLLTA